MRRVLLIILIFLTKLSFGQSNTDWIGQVTFPADFKVGDCVEFVGVHPTNAGASGNYEISISYTRGNIAAGATYLASISHANPDIWRELGRVNSNGYVLGSDSHCFTVDCNTNYYGGPSFRIRAIRVMGINAPLTVEIKIRSISQNTGWTEKNNVSSDLTVNKFLPMTNDWSLYVGNNYYGDGANLAIKAIMNGNVGIGTATPAEKLSVNGKIRAQEIKVESGNWPDYVFEEQYKLLPLDEVEAHIKEKGHLTGIPSAKEIKSNGIELGDISARLLQKIEELTLYLIELKKENNVLKTTIAKQNEDISALKLKLKL